MSSAERGSSDPSEYVLSVEQMIENDYPIPSYMADVDNEKLPGWVETPAESKLDQGKGKPKVKRKIYGIDCEMVGFRFFLFLKSLILSIVVHD